MQKKILRETGKRMRNTIPQARSESKWVQSMFSNFLYRTVFCLFKKISIPVESLAAELISFAFICKTNAQR